MKKKFCQNKKKMYLCSKLITNKARYAGLDAYTKTNG